jgi:prepilin-type processing-associated H-X9-DG protein
VTLCPTEYYYDSNIRQAIAGTLSDAVGYGIYSPKYEELYQRRYNFIPVRWNSGGWWDMGKLFTYSSGSIETRMYRLSGFRTPARTIFLADSVASYAGHQQTVEFCGQGVAFNNAAIHLIHKDKANVVMFDGHAETMTAYDMRYDTANAPDHFWAANAGPGGWNTGPMFSPPYQNISYPKYPTAP